MRRSWITGRLALMVFLLSCNGLAAQEGAGKVYKSVDEKGRVIFTDHPPADKSSELVRVQATNTASIQVDQKAEMESKDEEPVSRKVPYKRFAIVSPSNNQTLEYGVSSVDVVLALEPALQDGHRVQFILDGKPYDQPGTALVTRLGNLDRGTHTVDAAILDAKGKRVKATRAVKFTIQLHSYRADDERDYYDYPYGVGSPNGAGSIDGAEAPRDARDARGAESVEGAGSPGYPAVPVRPRVRSH
jgi:hypothetical protein